MISWQGQLLHFIVRFIAKISKATSPIDIVKRRNTIEKIAKCFKYKKGIISESFRIKHLTAVWLSIPQAKTKVILYLHGGAFVIGSINTHWAMMAKIAELTSLRVLGINYRLAPEYPFPAGLEDAVLAYSWLLQQGISAKSIIIVGDSSGGNLAIATALLLRDRQMPLPAAIACLSPWVDLTLSGESVLTNAHKDPLLTREMGELAAHSYFRNQHPELPLVSPLYADLTHLPPLYIQVSDAEVLYSDATRLAEKARIAGVDVSLQIYHQMMHSWQFVHTWVPEAMI